MAHSTKRKPIRNLTKTKHLSLDPEVVAMGIQLAKQDDRSFSAYVSRLIRQAFQAKGVA